LPGPGKPTRERVHLTPLEKLDEIGMKLKLDLPHLAAPISAGGLERDTSSRLATLRARQLSADGDDARLQIDIIPTDS
jgi:hypothetical protein